MPTRPAAAVQRLTFFAAAAMLLAAFACPRLRRNLEREQLYMLALLGAGIVLNGAICGALSGPHDRYEARVAWLVPFCALTVGIALWQRRGRTVERHP
jgi:hypothetical protein